ncbi:MAG TPA: hypothetical protein VJ957_10070 [Longimicrobiales bacterium]|nr:hypothetical protein [Longimicrobiales bacterium]
MMMRRTVHVAAALLALLATTRPLAAQSRHTPRDDARWHIALYGGTTSDGPAPDLQRAFLENGMAEAPPCGVVACSPKTYPYSVTGWGQTGLPFTAEVRFRAVGPAELAFILGRTPIGETVGYHYPTLLELSFGVTVIAATAGVAIPLPLPAGPRLRLGAGPARYGVFWTPIRDNRALSTGHETAIGLLARAGLEVPVDKGVLIGFDFQYRRVGTNTVGPIALPTVVNRNDLPAMLANFDHWCASIGFSVGL